MNPLRIIALYLLLLSAMEVASQSQTLNPPPQPVPAGPLIKLRAPEFSKWMVASSLKKPVGDALSLQNLQQEKMPVSKRIFVTKTKDIKYEQTVDGKGHPVEKWYYGGMEYSIDPVTRQRSAFEIGDNPLSDPDTNYTKTDFPGFEWISAKNYVENRKVLGVDCLVFKNEGTAIACVNLNTQLPVLLLMRSGTLRVYQFDTPPASELSLPQDIQEALNFSKQHTRDLMKMPPKPF